MTTHYVYTFWDAEDRALYVGCTSNIPQRIRTHLREREWFVDVARFDVSVYPDGLTAYTAEAARIKELQPLYNALHTERLPDRSLPCRTCRQGKHLSCVGTNRDGDRCPCLVCVRDRAAA